MALRLLAAGAWITVVAAAVLCTPPVIGFVVVACLAFTWTWRLDRRT